MGLVPIPRLSTNCRFTPIRCLMLGSWLRDHLSLAFLTMSIYTENGYANRKEYLNELRDEYGSDLVNALITVLPASEDFDGLVTMLEDAMDGF